MAVRGLQGTSKTANNKKAMKAAKLKKGKAEFPLQQATQTEPVEHKSKKQRLASLQPSLAQDSSSSDDAFGSEVSDQLAMRESESDGERAAVDDLRSNSDQDGEDEASEDEGPEPQDSMAQAFADILRHPGSSQKDITAPILLGSKSLAKRKREEAEANALQSRSKNVRQEIRQRSHKKVSRKGEDPDQDGVEKVLQKIATRGVVQLFNAVNKAQQARKEKLASGAKDKDSKISKSDFFAELKKGVAEAQRTSASAATKVTEVENSAGWDVLRPEFAGLQGKTSIKMKDWDKALPADLGLEDLAGIGDEGEDIESDGSE